jgi:hypothetical protein
MITPHSNDAGSFRDLPALLVRDVSCWPPGCEISFALLEYVGGCQGVIFRVNYKHRELTFRTPGGKDAVAFGEAMLESDSTPKDVRILFSQIHQTATMKGLAVEGAVKLLSPPKFVARV